MNIQFENLEVIESQAFAASVADELVVSINEALDQHESCSISLSGGSTPATVYRSLTTSQRAGQVDWKRIKLFLGDERWVSSDSSLSNFQMISETLFDKVSELGATIFAIDTKCESPQASAAKYSEVIRKEVGVNASGVPCFSLVLLGLGEDGHTASLFPGIAEVDNMKDLYLATEQPVTTLQAGMAPSRVSMGPSLIIAAEKVMFLVTGQAKSEMLKRALTTELPVKEMPAQLWRKCSGHVHWFVDTAAARDLKQ